MIGPDPQLQPDTLPRLFGIATLSAPQLVTWAAKGNDLASLSARARSHGIDLGMPIPGRRLRPNGTAITWELTDPLKPRAGGLLPFFIDWPANSHPGALDAAVIRLLDFHGVHPAPDRIAAQLRALAVDLRVKLGPAPALVATLRTPRGTVTLT